MAGYNCRMTDYQAALLDSQLKRLDGILEQKQHIADRYLNEIKHPCIKLPVISAGKLPSWQTFHVVLQDPLKQDDTIVKLRDAGIGTNYGAQCIPAQSYFLEKYKHDAQREFPQAWTAYHAGLAIPIYEKLNNDQVSHIIQTLNSL